MSSSSQQKNWHFLHFIKHITFPLNVWVVKKPFRKEKLAKAAG
jgi:hypothetical protein